MIFDDAIDTKEVAEMLRTNPAQVRMWRSRGQGPKYYRIVGTVFYRRSEVQAWIDEVLAGQCGVRWRKPGAELPDA